MAVTEQEVERLKQENDAALARQHEAHLALNKLQTKFSAAQRALRSATGKTIFDLVGEDCGNITALMNEHPGILSQYGFSASDYAAMKRESDVFRENVRIHNETSSAYFSAKEQLDEAEEEKRKARIAQKVEQSKAAQTQAAMNPGATQSAPSRPKESVTINKGGYVGRDGTKHTNTATVKNTKTGDSKVIDTDTGKVVGSQHAKPEERKQLQKAQEKSPEVLERERMRAEGEKKWEELVRFNHEVMEKRRKEEAERKAAEKEEKKKQKEEQKAQDKIRRQKDHERREKERQQNKKEYDEALAKYKKERAEAQEKAKKEREEAAKKRHEEYVKQKEAKSKEGDEAGKNAYKQINDYTYTQKENYRQQVKDGGYKGTTAEAKADLKNTLKDIWNMGTGDARKELSGAYKDISPSIDTLKNARSAVQDLYNGKIIGGVTEMAANAQMALSAGALAAVDKDGMVNLQKVILTQKLADRAVLDNISDAVKGQMATFKDAGTAIKNAYLVQQAYVAAYVKQTFGNPQFMKNITGVVAIKVGNYVEAWTNETVNKYMNKANDKIDSVFTRVDQKIDNVTSKIDGALDKVDKLTKIDLLSKMNDKIDSFTSLDGIQNKLNKSPIGSLLSPIVGTVGAVGGVAIKGMFAQSGILGAVSKIQSKMVKFQDKIVKAREFVHKKVEMLKSYLNDLKEKAKAFVQEFANKIVNDIKSKIQSAVVGAIGGGFKL